MMNGEHNTMRQTLVLCDRASLSAREGQRDLFVFVMRHFGCVRLFGVFRDRAQLCRAS